VVKITCPVCNGRGRVPDRSYVGLMAYYDPSTGERGPHVTCPACGGTGLQEMSDEAYAGQMGRR